MSKESRLYTLYEKRDGRWVALMPSMKYHKSTAIQVFQSALLNGSMTGRLLELRPAK